MKHFKTGSCLFQKREMKKKIGTCGSDRKHLTETMSMTLILKT